MLTLGNEAVEKIQVYVRFKNSIMMNEVRSIIFGGNRIQSSVPVDNREIVRISQSVLGHIVWCMEVGDLHSGTLRDGNHKPTIPSAGALGLNLSAHQNGWSL